MTASPPRSDGYPTVNRTLKWNTPGATHLKRRPAVTGLHFCGASRIQKTNPRITNPGVVKFPDNEPTDSLYFLGNNTPGLLLRRALMPPWIYLRGLALFAFTAKPHTFILGHAYPHGVWFYFPVLFLLKSPLAFLLLLVLALMVGLVAKFRVVQLAAIPKGRELHWRAVWVSLVVFTAACMLSRFQISIRHFSVSLALLVLLLAPLPRMLESLRRSSWPAARAGVWLTVALALASVATAVRAYPNYLPFLNS